MSSLNLPSCNLSPLLLVLPDMETKFILPSAQLFLKTDILQKMYAEFSLQGGAGTQTLAPKPLVTHLHIRALLVLQGSQQLTLTSELG